MMHVNNENQGYSPILYNNQTNPCEKEIENQKKERSIIDGILSTKNCIIDDSFSTKSRIFDDTFSTKTPNFDDTFSTKSPIFDDNFSTKSPIFDVTFSTKTPIYDEIYTLKSSIFELSLFNSNQQKNEGEEDENSEVIRNKLYCLPKNGQILKKTDIFTISNENRKRGKRKTKIQKYKRTHTKNTSDNILRKIQVHFLSFIIAFTNDLIEVFLPHNKDIRFKNFNYDLKKTVNHSYVEQLKNKTIGEILQFDASSKNRKFDASINLRTYQKICGISPSLQKFFEISYLELFNKYYYKNNRIICFEGKNIIISQKTKLFEDLIQKNIESADKIKQIAINNFIEKQQSYKLPIFKIKKNIINK